MKKLFLIVAMLIMVSGCSTINHKNIEASGYGITYKSTVAIDLEDIPAFIKAVDDLQKILIDMDKKILFGKDTGGTP